MGDGRITLCMIVRDEALCLADTIASFAGEYDELLIVDTGSTDDTVAVAEGLGARVEHFVWCDSFAAARNYASGLCETEWVLMPDADERLAPECKGMVRQLVQGADPEVSEFAPILVCPGNATTEHYCAKLYRREFCEWRNPSHNVLVTLRGHSVRVPQLRLYHERRRRGKEQNDRRDAQRNEMNERNFRQQLQENPENHRARWYLALTVQEAGRPEEAIPLWLDYLAVGTWPEERYEARRELAACYIATGDTTTGIEQLVLAHVDEPRRAECAMRLGDMYAAGRAYLRAALWYDVAARAPEPFANGCQLFIVRECYGPYPLLRKAAMAQVQGDIDAARAYGEAAVIVCADYYPEDVETVRETAAGYCAPINSEVYWDRLYAAGRDVGGGHRAMYEAMAEVIAAQPGVRTVLDVAAGTGELVDALQARGLTAEGVDFSAEAAARHASLRQDDALTLATCADGSMDAVCSSSLLEHLEAPEQALEQMVRVLRPGGLLVACVPIETGPLYFEHLRQYTPETLADALRPYVGAVQTQMAGRHCIAWGRKPSGTRTHDTRPLASIYCGPAYEPWGPLTARLHGLRGAWKAAAQLAAGLTARDWRVKVWGAPSWDAQDGPGEWFPHGEYAHTRAGDVLIACRRSEILADAPDDLPGIYWHHDLADAGPSGYRDGLLHVCVSQWQADLYRERSGDIATEIIPVGVDTDLFCPGDGRRSGHLLFAAQPQRGLGVMLDCWDKLRDRLGPDAVLDVVGGFRTWTQEGHDPDQLRALATRALRTTGVRLWGMVPECILADLMRTANLLVYPATWRETYCTVAAEAQASGLPIVASALGALPDTCAGDVGVLVDGEPSSPEWQAEFIDQCVGLVSDSERMYRLRSAGPRVAAKRFGLPVVIEQWDRLLRSVLA